MDRIANLPNRAVGRYFGTEIDGKWWWRFVAEGWRARGNGEFWLDESGLNFQRYQDDKRLFIPFSSIESITTGSWHSGRWARGVPIVKITWTLDRKRLCTGFVLAESSLEKLEVAQAKPS